MGRKVRRTKRMEAKQRGGRRQREPIGKKPSKKWGGGGWEEEDTIGTPNERD